MISRVELRGLGAQGDVERDGERARCGHPFAAGDLILSDEVMKAIDKVSKEIRYPMG